VAYYLPRTPNPEPRTPIRIETKAGIIAAKVIGDKVSIKLSDPQGIKLNIPLTVFGRQLRVNFINTGVPHTVIFVEGLEKIDVAALGRRIRYHKFFAPAGTNVDFVEVVDNHTIKIRTYERGVEGETLACGTGSVAAALITSYQSLDFARDGSRDGERVEPLPVTSYSKTSCHTQSGETLKVYFQKELKHFSNVWLEGKAQVVFTGTIKSKGGRR
jgi:diaminopimelate epimerase